MSIEENLRVALQHLIGLEEHTSFYKNYIQKQEIETSTNLDDFFGAFKSHLNSLGKWNDEHELTFRIIKEQADIVKHQKSQSPIFFINNSRKLNDKWLSEFHIEFKDCLTGDQFVGEIKPKRYKTITENLIIF